MISWLKIKLMVYDFDGVMTDNTALVSEDGIEMVRVNRSDGLAIKAFKKAGYTQYIVSTEANPVVTKRAEKLNIDVIQNCENKLNAINKLCETLNIIPEDVLYIGNDINDLEAMNVVGFKVCPQDAYSTVKQIADVVTKAKGGEGVIRELYDHYLQSQ